MVRRYDWDVAESPKLPDTRAADAEDITAMGEEFVVVRGDGALVPIDQQGRVADADPWPGVTSYSAELQSDGTLPAVGSGGTIVKGGAGGVAGHRFTD